MGKTDKRLLINLDSDTASLFELVRKYYEDRQKMGKLAAVQVVRIMVRREIEREKIKTT